MCPASFRSVVGIAGLVGLILPLTARSATIRVPADEPTIQAGIDAANQGDLVLVAPGLYTGVGNRDVRFHGKAITVRSEGGAGSAILDCQGQGNGFIFRDHETASTVLDGFTIQHAGAAAALGGAILCRFACSPLITNCVIRDNHSSVGAGLYIIQGASPRIQSCQILSNFATIYGSGIYIQDGAPEIVDCEIADNMVDADGSSAGILCSGTPAVTIARCTFRANITPGKGFTAGALYCGYGTYAITDCRFIDNRAGNGGGVFCSGGQVVFTRCLFVGNRAELWGGAIHAGYGSDVTLASCTLVSNSAGDAGGGIYASWGNVEARNTIITFGLEGEAVACRDGLTELACCDIYDNAGGDWVGCIAKQADILGNFTADPLFCSVTGGDYHLDAASPCSPEHSGDCGLVGAFPVGCGSTAVNPTTWGRVKATFGKAR